MVEDQDEFPIERRPKRRKPNHPSQNFQHSKGYATGKSNDVVSEHSDRTSHESGEDKAAQDKPKNKYRIHVPKNGELPRDDFYTQPPQRSSSPYRIEPFLWQKPKTAIPVRPGPAETSIEPMTSEMTCNNRKPKAHKGHESAYQHQLDAETHNLQVLNKPPSEGYEDVLADLPSDAFSSPERRPTSAFDEPITISSQLPDSINSDKAWQPLKIPQANLRQTTLFGQKTHTENSSSQSTRRRNWPLANREEPPTHHLLNLDALQTWIYPTNLGSIRDYQYGIVAKGLYHNMLVALPTGLGKTFIAATIMLNWFRWTQDAQIVFVAPTKPLVSQQVKACFEIAGIPRAVTVMLTGNTPPGVRAEEWHSKRVFFMTPQTLINDLKSGIADPKRIVLVVVDEAHRATGGYAYVEVVKFLNRFNTSFRVLALTATPGASVESVQEVIDGLGISRIEIRTEESLDIRQYVHARKIETVLFDYSDEMAMLMDLYSKSLQPLLNKLNGMNAYWPKDPMTLTPYGCSQASRTWMASDAGKKAHWSVKNTILKTFSLLASLSHATELLKFHGIGPFFRKVLSFQEGEKGDKQSRQVREAEHFQKLVTRLRLWMSNADFVGHPKLEYLQRVAMNHFLDAGEGRGATDPSRTRIMVFAHYRDSAEEIARVLKRNEPLIRPHVFVGQASAKDSDGMDQKTQLAIISKFKDGTYNTLVATSIGEEGLDIGEIDLIMCYDASASPIRMLQRMGRTGRKRAGNIVVTLMKGKEENNFIKAKDNYEKMQHEIAAGTKFNFHDESNRRIVPKNVQPVVDKKIVDIPPENTQPELPEPTKRAKAPKKPPKKFNMPDNVRTGFVKASRLDEDASDEDEVSLRSSPLRVHEPSPTLLPSLDEVLLTGAEEQELERTYLDVKDVKGDAPQIVHVPRMDAYPHLQRSLRPWSRIAHGQMAKRTVALLSKMHSIDATIHQERDKALHPGDRGAGVAQAQKRAIFLDRYSNPPQTPSMSPHTTGTSQRTTVKPKHRNATLVGGTVDFLSGDDAGAGILSIGEEEVALSTLRATSSAFSPPSLANARQPFYLPPSRSYAADTESGEDLPDFGLLVGKPKSSVASFLSDPRKDQVISAPARRNAERKILEDDSDDE